MTRTAPVENYTAEFPVTLGRGTNKVIAVANAGTHHRVSDLAVWRLRPNQ